MKSSSQLLMWEDTAIRCGGGLRNRSGDDRTRWDSSREVAEEKTICSARRQQWRLHPGKFEKKKQKKQIMNRHELPIKILAEGDKEISSWRVK